MKIESLDDILKNIPTLKSQFQNYVVQASDGLHILTHDFWYEFEVEQVYKNAIIMVTEYWIEYIQAAWTGFPIAKGSKEYIYYWLVREDCINYDEISWFWEKDKRYKFDLRQDCYFPEKKCERCDVHQVAHSILNDMKRHNEYANYEKWKLIPFLPKTILEDPNFQTFPDYKLLLKKKNERA